NKCLRFQDTFFNLPENDLRRSPKSFLSSNELAIMASSCDHQAILSYLNYQATLSLQINNDRIKIYIIQLLIEIKPP
ncbi:TPA: hypothetical protein I7719_09645, partial [Vibrio vulnificus]|nr:hypothetical protein [Vibrio vulnificus]